MHADEVKFKSVLKECMKERGLQYGDMAKELGVSEATIKRWLNKGSLGVSELARFAEVFGLSLVELLELGQDSKQKTFLFSEEQEKVLAKDVRFIMLFRHVLLGKTFSTIRQEMKLTDSELRKMLRRLEEIELLRLMQGDVIRPLAHFPFKWRENGILEKTYFKEHIAALFARIDSTIVRSTYEEKSGRLCKPFEFYLTEKDQREFGEELMAVYSRFVTVSKRNLKFKNESGRVVSGILNVDAFSLWDSKMS